MSAHSPVWREIFPELARADPATQAIMEQAHWVTLPAGAAVFQAGNPCQHYLLMVAGQVRVQLIGAGGREAVLYRVQPGQSCVLTTCCVLSGEPYPAEGHADGEVSALLFTQAEFARALETAPGFRRFVFHDLGQRLAEVIRRMEEVAFQPVEQRLASLLLERTPADGRLRDTHQALALELGTAREVVSRHLKRLEAAGLVRLGRSSIQIRDRAGLRELVQGAG